MDTKPKFNRLPKSITPVHYAITIKPEFNTFTFDGKTSIRINVTQPTEKITLSAANLTISEVTLSNIQKSCTPLKITLTTEPDTTVIFEFATILEIGEYTLTILYTGSILDKLWGFYRTKNEVDGQVKYGTATQFEPMGARNCFPCWDEPNWRATFDIALDVPSELMAISNMPVKKTEKNRDDRTMYVFETTPKMPTYLVAFVIGDYDYREVKLDNLPIRIYTHRKFLDEITFALDVAHKVLNFYNKYFEIPYSLPKLDLIALTDFAGGAMENWGLITFRAMCLRINSANSTDTKKEKLALLIAHEISHTWFGNLVTMEWWTNLWLKEGFANFMQCVCVNAIFPEFRVWDHFVSDNHMRALRLDALKNSHAIEVPINHPAEISEIFDGISYSKGAALVRMVYGYVGDETFRKSIILYLNRHKYGCTDTNDFWNALEEVSGEPVKEVMSTWTRQVGFPLVSASIVTTSSNKQVLKLSQKRWLSDNSTDDTLWSIPIQITTKDSPHAPAYRIILKQKEQIFELDNLENCGWLRINGGVVGFYRSIYSPGLNAKLIEAAVSGQLPVLDRLGFIDDNTTVALIGNEFAPIARQLETVSIFASFEDNYIVWTSICEFIANIAQVMSDTDIYLDFLQFAYGCLSKIASTINWEPVASELHSTKLLRTTILNLLIDLNHGETIERGYEIYKNREATSIPVELRTLCYRCAMRLAPTETLKTFLNIYEACDSEEEKNRVVTTLGDIEDAKLARKAFEYSVSDAVRSQDRPNFFGYLTRSKEARKLVWQHVKQNWALLVAEYSGPYLLTEIVNSVMTKFASTDEITQLQDFLRDQNLPGTKRITQQALEKCRMNAVLLGMKDEIGDFLKRTH